jgi:hypothetical protein
LPITWCPQNGVLTPTLVTSGVGRLGLSPLLACPDRPIGFRRVLERGGIRSRFPGTTAFAAGGEQGCREDEKHYR